MHGSKTDCMDPFRRKTQMFKWIYTYIIPYKSMFVVLPPPRNKEWYHNYDHFLLQIEVFNMYEFIQIWMNSSDYKWMHFQYKIDSFTFVILNVFIQMILSECSSMNFSIDGIVNTCFSKGVPVYIFSSQCCWATE